MTLPRSRPDRIGRLLSGLARRLDLPFFGPSGPASRGDTDAHGRRSPSKPRPVTSLPPSDPALRSVRLAEQTLDYRLRRARRKTIGFSIAVGGLTVAAPRWVGVRQIEDAIRDREAWVLAKLADLRRHQASIPQVRWEDGATIPYLGAPITMRLVASVTRTTRAPAPSFDRDRRTLTLVLPPGAPPEQIRDRVTTWLQSEARTLFRQRLAIYESRLGVRHRLLRLSSAKTRWGSCSADGRILLNWRLIHFPLASVDYVVAHELSHLKEMNHGPRFWATVASVLPDYQAARDQVRNPSPELLPTL